MRNVCARESALHSENNMEGGTGYVCMEEAGSIGDGGGRGEDQVITIALSRYLC